MQASEILMHGAKAQNVDYSKGLEGDMKDDLSV